MLFLCALMLRITGPCPAGAGIVLGASAMMQLAIAVIINSVEPPLIPANTWAERGDIRALMH
jgi:hypothetical protein